MEYAWLKRKNKEKHKDLARYLERTKPVVEWHLINAGIPIINIHSRASIYTASIKNYCAER